MTLPRKIRTPVGWVSKQQDHFDRMAIPGWLLKLLDGNDRRAIVNAELNCSTRYYRELLAERRIEIDSKKSTLGETGATPLSGGGSRGDGRPNTSLEARTAPVSPSAPLEQGVTS